MREFRCRTRHRGKSPLVGKQFGQPRVQPGPLAGEQVSVDGLTKQRVPECVPCRAIGDKQLVRDRLADSLFVLGRG